MIRRITIDDLPDCFAIARSCYTTPFDERAMYDWAVKAIHSPTTIAIRSEDAFGCAMVNGIAWQPSELHGAQLFIAVRNKAAWEACKLMRLMRDWAVDVMGAVDYQFGEATSMRMDVIAKRIGAVPNSPTFVYRGKA